MKLDRQCIVGLTLGVIGLAFTACTPGAGVRHVGPDPRIGPVSLVAYDSCDAALNSLKAAARLAISQYGETPVPEARSGAGQAQAGSARSAEAAAPSTVTSAPDYSGTNVHEPGVDEPDIVKTDGSRIVTVTNNVLRTVDVTSRSLTGALTLPGHPGAPAELLLRGDRALVPFPRRGYQPAWRGPISGPTLLMSSSSTCRAHGRSWLAR